MSCFWDIFDRFLIVLDVVYFYHSLENIIFDDTLARFVEYVISMLDVRKNCLKFSNDKLRYEGWNYNYCLTRLL